MVSMMRIKFTRTYSESRTIKKLVFSKMVLNYDEYSNLEEIEEYNFYKFSADV